MIEKILNKISKYELFTGFIPGVVCVYFINKISNNNILIDNIIIDIGVIYFFGFMSEILGSFFIDGILEKVSYDNYVKADKRDNKIKNITLNIHFAEGLIGSSFIILLYLVLEKVYFDDLIYLIFLFALLILIRYIEKELDYLTKRVDNKKQNSNKKKQTNNKPSNEKMKSNNKIIGG